MIVKNVFNSYLPLEWTYFFKAYKVNWNLLFSWHFFLIERVILTNFQRAKKEVSDSPWLVDFAIGLVNSVFNLPNGQVMFFEEFKWQKNCEISLLIKMFLGLVEMMFGLVNVSFSLPEWQAVKMTFFAPWNFTLKKLKKFQSFC